MKVMLCSLSICLMLIACSKSVPQQVDSEVEIRAKVSTALELAQQNKDYRLLGLQSRRMAIPGIEPNKAAEYIKSCGVKLLKNTGDVLKSEQQKKQRLETLKFASLYNPQVLTLCQQQ